MWLVTAVAVLPWSRCSTCSVSHASPATPICEGNLFTPWIKRVTVKVVTLWVTGQAYGQLFSLQLWFKCLHLFQSTLERCSKCSKPILDRILRAMGKAYHPRCFTCVVCNCCLDGVPFTVDATSQIHCIEDFHRYDHISAPLHKHFCTFCDILFFFLPGRKYAPRCSVCGEPIMPEQGQEETVRIVALDRSFHVNCYVCEVRMKPESVWYHKLSTVLHWTDWSVCPPGMRAPAVLRGGGARLLPTGRPHPVQELQRSAHPGPVGQNLHWLLIWKHPCKTSRFVALRAVAPVASLILAREHCPLRIRSRLTSNLVSCHSETPTFPFCYSFSPSPQ